MVADLLISRSQVEVYTCDYRSKPGSLKSFLISVRKPFPQGFFFISGFIIGIVLVQISDIYRGKDHLVSSVEQKGHYCCQDVDSCQDFRSKSEGLRRQVPLRLRDSFRMRTINGEVSEWMHATKFKAHSSTSEG
jgi:hypothetical protein